MCTATFHLVSYNTHLFPGEPLNIGPIFEDGARKTAINHTYLELLTPYAKSGVIQIAALQEVWDGKLADDIAEDVDSSHHGTLNCHYAQNRTVGLNPSGLLLLADPACRFDHETSVIYKAECGLAGWSGQDLLVEKGYLQVTCSFPCSKHPGTQHALGLFTTHMPVAFGQKESHAAVSCAFQTLAAGIKNFRTAPENKGLAVFLLGDLNVDVYRTHTLDDGHTEYTEAVTNTLMDGTALHDAAAEQAVKGSDPGPTVRPGQNTLWQYFNGSTQPYPDPQRIDYFFYADSPDGTMAVAVQSVTVKTDGLTIQNGKYNCSDHFPLEVSLTVSVQD